MYCSSCGSALTAGQQNCPVCGARTPNFYAGISASDPTVISSRNGQRPLAPGDHIVLGPPSEGVDTPDYRLYPQNPQYLSSDSQNAFTTAPVSNTSYSYVPPPPPQNPYNIQPGGQQIPYYPTPPIQQGKRQPRSKGRFVAILLILLVLLIGSVGFIYSATVSRENTLHLQATAGAQAAGTSMARATTKAQATAAVVNPYTSSGALAFSDPLIDNSKGQKWDENRNCAFKSDGYHVLAPNASYGDYCTAQATDVKNFAFEANMKIIQGDGGGIDFRSNNGGGTNQYYDFYVFQNGSYELDIVTGPKAKALTSGASVAIKQGLNQTNLLAAVVEGQKISVYANHQLVSSVSDGTYSHGQIGLEANPFAADGHQTDVLYSDVKVWTL